VREGRISQKLALRLLRAFPAECQIRKVSEAMAAADKYHRTKLLPKDFDWGSMAEADRAAVVPVAGHAGGPPEVRVDRVRARLCDLASRLAGAARFAPNPVASDRLGTLSRIHLYATGKLSYARLEAHLLGRE
jgi:hypothetical protein